MIIYTSLELLISQTRYKGDVRRIGEVMPIISISLDEESEKKLCKIAGKMDRKVSDAVRQLIKEYKFNE